MNVRERLFHNLELKLLALALAVILWFYVAGGKSAEVTIEVPVKVIDLPPGLALVAQPPDHLDVRVAGPTIILKRLRQDKMVVSLDMGQVKAGSVAFSALDQRVPVPAGIRVVRVSPATIELAVRSTAAGEVPGNQLRGADR
jgi:hypothetical protein